MATTNDGTFNLPYPQLNDPVNVHGDIEALAKRLQIVLPPLGISAFQIPVINTSGERLEAGCPVFINGYTTKTTVGKYIPSTNSVVLGLLKQPLQNNAEGLVVVAGVLENIPLTNSSFVVGNPVYVGPDGWLSYSQIDGGTSVGVIAKNGENGVIIVEAKGNGTWGALKAGLA
jgi:hypothetical protein